jgi:hypothetical protein
VKNQVLFTAHTEYHKTFFGLKRLAKMEKATIRMCHGYQDLTITLTLPKGGVPIFPILTESRDCEILRQLTKYFGSPKIRESKERSMMQFAHHGRYVYSRLGHCLFLQPGQELNLTSQWKVRLGYSTEERWIRKQNRK